MEGYRMSILTQSKEVAYQKLQNEVPEELITYLSPYHWVSSALNYGHLISYIDQMTHQYARNMLKTLFETMDQEYRESEERKAIYYVKTTRERTIITIFGEVTYKRTEYQHKQTKESICYVDRKIGLEKRMRYDPVISSLAYALYANQNSMIKVGQLLGNLIYGFSLDQQQCREAIPRQTIWRMTHRFKEIAVPYAKEEVTPKILYIMADEKYIPLQGIDKSSQKMMIKLGVSFEAIDGDSKRHSLKNTKYFYYQEGNFWDKLYHHINQIYDIDQIEHIYILGDGASWIKAGTTEFERSKFGLCKFHFMQAVENITDENPLKQLILDYAIHNDKSSLKKLFHHIIKANPTREVVLKQKTDYILNNIQSVQAMYQEIKVGCPMEQAIQHVLQSVFTSIPKAYSEKYLPTYVNTRINHMNHVNLQLPYLTALDNPSEDNRITLSSPMYSDFSISSNQSYKDTYPFHLPYSDAYKKLK